MKYIWCILLLKLACQNPNEMSEYFEHLTPEEKSVIVDKGTEAPFTGEYNDFYEEGTFVCRACNNPLYDSSTKFDAGCGWPAFDKVKRVRLIDIRTCLWVTSVLKLPVPSAMGI